MKFCLVILKAGFDTVPIKSINHSIPMIYMVLSRGVKYEMRLKRVLLNK